MHQTRMVLEDAQVGHGHRAGACDPPEVIADQVGDHHVLGHVLGTKLRGHPARALDGAGGDGAAPSAQEQLRAGGHHPDTSGRQIHDPRVRGGVADLEPGVQCPRIGVGGEGGGQHAAKIDLVDVTGGDELPYLLDPQQVLLAGQAAAPCLVRGTAPGSSPGDGSTAHLAEPGERCVALEGDHHGPEPGTLQRTGIVGEVAQPRGEHPVEPRPGVRVDRAGGHP